MDVMMVEQLDDLMVSQKVVLWAVLWVLRKAATRGAMMVV